MTPRAPNQPTPDETAEDRKASEAAFRATLDEADFDDETAAAVRARREEIERAGVDDDA